MVIRRWIGCSLVGEKRFENTIQIVEQKSKTVSKLESHVVIALICGFFGGFYVDFL